MRVDAVKPAGGDQVEDGASALGVSIAAVEHPIFTTYNNCSERASACCRAATGRCRARDVAPALDLSRGRAPWLRGCGRERPDAPGVPSRKTLQREAVRAHHARICASVAAACERDRRPRRWRECAAGPARRSKLAQFTSRVALTTSVAFADVGATQRSTWCES